MRTWTTVLALAVAVFAHADQKALLIAVDDYPALKGQPKLAGAAEDLRLAKAFVSAYGASDVKTLLRAEAKKAAIESALDALAQSVKGGDIAVLYFSGRGGRARGKDELLVPTLAPYDAIANSGSGDVSMERVEAWVNAVRGKHATPVVILDACWGKLETRSVEARPYNPNVRFFDRGAKGDMRAKLLDGPAIVLSAADASSAAYEWKTGEDTWAGAFTNMLLNAANSAAIRDESPSADDLIAEINRQTVQYRAQGYMPGYEPLALNDRGGPLFEARFKLETQGAVGELIAKQREEAKLYRIAVDIDSSVTSPEERSSIFRSVYRPLKSFVSTKLDGVLCVEPNASRPDRVIVFSMAEGKIAARVLKANRVNIETDFDEFAGTTIDEVMSQGLGSLLQQDAVLQRFYRLAISKRTATEPTLDMKTEFRVGDDFIAQVSGTPGDAYVFDRSDIVGSVDLQFPNIAQPKARVTASQPLRLPATGAWKFSSRSPLGRSQYTVIVVNTPSGLKLPAIGGKDDKSFRASLVPHLKALIDAMSIGKATWSVKTLDYTVSGS